MSLVAGTVVDRYVVVRLLGRGGMASVFEVRHAELGTRHALKVLTVSIQASRMRREGRAQGSLRHPNVVAVTDLVDVDGVPSLVMELVDGPPLDRFLAGGVLGVAQVDALAAGVLDGVAAAHAQGVVHRDLKPANVLLSVHGSALVPKVTDFGLAKLVGGPVDTAHTRSGATMGTPAYMSPEQIRDSAAVDARADVWSLGAILYELATGAPAFPGDDVFEVFDRIRRADFRPPRELRPDLPERWEDAIRGALVVDPDARIGTVEELRRRWTAGVVPADAPWDASALGRARRIEPTPTPASSSTFQVPPTVVEPRARRPWVALLAGAALALALVASVWTTTRSPAARLLTRYDAPTVSSEPDVQRDFERAWSAVLDVDPPEAERLARGVVERVPDDPLPWMLALAACVEARKVGCIMDAMDAAARVAGERQGADADLVRLTLELRKDPTGALPALLAHIERYPDDYYARCVAGSFEPSSPAPTGAAAALLALPDPPPVAYFFATAAATAHGRPDETLRVAREGVERHPRSAVLRSILGETLAAAGELPEARIELRRAIELDPGLVDTKMSLGVVVLALGDEDAFRAIDGDLTGETSPVSTRLAWADRSAEALFHRLRVREARQRLDRGTALAEAEGRYADAYELLIGGLALAYEAADWPTYGRDLARIRGVLLAPEFPPAERDASGFELLAWEGMAAAARGEVAAAEALRRRLGPETVTATVLAALDRAIALASGETVPSASCEDRIADARAARAAGRLEDARTAATGALDVCGHDDGWSRAEALVTVAEGELRAGRPEAARAALATFREGWPLADPDGPLAIRAAAVASP